MEVSVSVGPWGSVPGPQRVGVGPLEVDVGPPGGRCGPLEAVLVP